MANELDGLVEYISTKIIKKWQDEERYCTFNFAHKNGSYLFLIFKYDDWTGEGVTPDGMMILMFAFEVTLKRISLIPLPLGDEQMSGYNYDMRPYDDAEICPAFGFEILKDTYQHFNHYHAGKKILKQIHSELLLQLRKVWLNNIYLEVSRDY
ncbi:hypothetical protein [Segetibacter aerophilus]|uniref:Uncharacterized protein n=1 Tax=Segetibacter aerophilus TaxID=670293 RepID=A0A512B8M7_9BACT|nr:hypothetical protein [Segetibacter aerophilus]GEO08314.1 hypothetical protein SAE01_08100 [Segetibacter aerophilus]